MAELPAGLITLVFTDIEGSSLLWESHREAFTPVLEEHNRLLRAVAEQWNGVEVKTEGDAFFLVFARASDAVRFALDAQTSLQGRIWSLPGLDELRVRIGMHSGEPILARHPDGSGDYFGPVVNRAARVGGAGHGGQIVLSGVTRDLSLPDLAEEAVWLDLGLHRLKGVGDEALWQVTLDGLPDRFPALKTMAGAKHNLPQPATAFIGRERELREWGAMLLEERVRLLTVLAFGGQGKTRLALQLAEGAVENFTDGVWWVNLEHARDAESMLEFIASELRLHLRPQVTVREQVLDFHRDRELLLVLDNTEQIEGAGQVVRQILDAAPRVKCLVTTRRALDIKGEQRVHLAPLSLEEAVQLFATRAAERDPDFEISPENEPDIRQLCQELEAVPLAIELAASRITVMTPADMLDRLDERFRLLTSRAADVPPRQRALRGAIDWSYDLLNEEDKQLLAELSVFAGGFSMADAEAVCTVEDAMEGVDQLSRHSLLQVEMVAKSTWFSMQASVRAYAAEKLEESGAAEAMRGRHATHFSKLVARYASALRGKGEAEALAKGKSNQANFHAAMLFAADARDTTALFSLGLRFHDLLYHLGYWDEARAVLDQLLPAVDPGLDAALAASYYLRSASLAQDRGDLERANREVLLARPLAESGGDPLILAAVLNLLGLLASDGGDDTAATAFFRQSLDSAPATDHHSRAVAWHNLGRLASRGGDPEEAGKLYATALQARRDGGDLRGEAETLGNLGVLAQNAGDLAAAAKLYRESLTLRVAQVDRVGIALMLHNLAEIAQLEGDNPRAITLFIHAERIFRELGSVYAAAPREALEGLRGSLGDEFEGLKTAAEGAAWEDWVGE